MAAPGLGLLLGLLSTSPVISAPISSWQYDYTPYPDCQSLGVPGPHCWRDVFHECGSPDTQSPINLAGVAPARGLEAIAAHTVSACNSAKFYNNGRAWVVDVETTCAHKFELEFEGTHYEMEHVHFHSPSEHTMGGSPLDAEAHLIHRDAGHHRTLVVAVLLRASTSSGVTTNHFLDFAFGFGRDASTGRNNTPTGSWDTVSNASHAPAVTLFRPFDPYSELLPASPAYFTYTGSLTEPPCSSDVKWIIMAQPVSMSPFQAERMRTSLYRVNGNQTNINGLTNQFVNNRPVRALAGREVRYFSGGVEEEEGEEEEEVKEQWYQPILEPLGGLFSFLGVCVMALGGFVAIANLIILGIVKGFGLQRQSAAETRSASSLVDMEAEQEMGCLAHGIQYGVCTRHDPGVEHRRELSLNLVRSQLAKSICLSLEILVAADVIDTLAKPVDAQTFTELGYISIIVAIRTVLSLHLAHELHDIEAEEAREAKDKLEREKQRRRTRSRSRSRARGESTPEPREQDAASRGEVKGARGPATSPPRRLRTATAASIVTVDGPGDIATVRVFGGESRAPAPAPLEMGTLTNSDPLGRQSTGLSAAS